ncbi:MAG TPA: MSMEG_0569 family flavin-dependent oxidoreductase [Tepidisphaeraceae bacterium]|jgi:putative flavoprotein involved in K+ transport
MEHFPVIVIGGGQSGLSVSYCLKQAGIRHVVLERSSVAHAWQTQRWDTFCLVTPNWQCKLPGFDYRGADPNGFMVKDEIVRYVRDYAASFDAPVREGVGVTKLTRNEDGYVLETTAGPLMADQVVVAVGGYHRPIFPPVAEKLPADVVQIHSSQYRNPGQLPAGDVLVIGTGQSGCQIAEDLHLAGRRVHLCVGGAPRVARRYRGRDVVDWLADMGYYDLPVDKHPLKGGVRQRANHYVTGRDGGRDIDLRQRALEGMKLYGRLDSIDGPTLRFKPDLAANLDKADEVSESIKTSIDKHIAASGASAPEEARYRPVWTPGEETTHLDLTATGVSAVVWCVGFKSDFSWIDVPVFDGRGYPGHTRGVTGAPGLYFVGLPWLYTWGSGRFSGIGRDASFVVEHLSALRRPTTVASWTDGRAFSELAFGT